jgi:sulfide:quinone oxidoreductase
VRGRAAEGLYLSCDTGAQRPCSACQASFFNAGAVLFGVPDYVPALMSYIDKYGIDLNYRPRLTAVDGPNKRATFVRTLPDGSSETASKPSTCCTWCRRKWRRTSSARARWPMPPAGSMSTRTPCATAVRQHPRLGDVANTSNAKTAAAARKQAPVVANNVLVALGRCRPRNTTAMAPAR